VVIVPWAALRCASTNRGLGEIAGREHGGRAATGCHVRASAIPHVSCSTRVRGARHARRAARACGALVFELSLRFR